MLFCTCVCDSFCNWLKRYFSIMTVLMFSKLFLYSKLIHKNCRVLAGFLKADLFSSIIFLYLIFIKLKKMKTCCSKKAKQLDIGISIES